MARLPLINQNARKARPPQLGEEVTVGAGLETEELRYWTGSSKWRGDLEPGLDPGR